MKVLVNDLNIDGWFELTFRFFVEWSSIHGWKILDSYLTDEELRLILKILKLLLLK